MTRPPTYVSPQETRTLTHDEVTAIVQGLRGEDHDPAPVVHDVSAAWVAREGIDERTSHRDRASGSVHMLLPMVGLVVVFVVGLVAAVRWSAPWVGGPVMAVALLSLTAYILILRVSLAHSRPGVERLKIHSAERLETRRMRHMARLQRERQDHEARLATMALERWSRALLGGGDHEY